MNVAGWALWGFVSTLVLTTSLAVTQGLNLTRINLPYFLGTMLAPGRDRANLIGFVVHLVNGMIFSLLYVAIFTSWHRAAWWLGAILGLVHAFFVLTIGLSLVAALHPRMATEQQGPTVTRQLEPPGFLARNYGPRTALSVLFAHVIYGAILGAFYTMPR